ncbi:MULTISPECIES: EscU/YscU/HrcU family type III secretion system export apparatus switch protein [unclassified Cryobacterium]|uniref:EscU/YscU/HrcU family type III secretion system export apparatus switch protein n=1 Tax=unclassified Cryobacterium TaxID=2649013 RepID=UPI00106DD19B|nr:MULTISPECIES: EscU/YscU/HrcU family type III secretion system export apparatus switch protein [unclassified Cryobacterium]TFC34389.1 EscU/YscU/HrcU family type III secretion system export apparatus switch protein [Cryobacterium sp. TMT2-42-4]TFC61364.1 EscU/YscU/HrcU family type III secretion system export apparatus switch protein [Cryobacterium sp. TMT2-15-1]
MSDSGEKTEQATDKRMREVRSKGQLSKSQDLTAWIGIGAAAAMTPVTIGLAADAGTDQMIRIRSLVANPQPDLAVQMLVDSLASMGTILTPMLATVFVVVLVGAVAQGGVHFKKVAGKYEQFNLVTGLGRTFGGQAVWQGVKALLKTIAVGLVLVLVVQGLAPILMTAGGLPVSVLIGAAGDGATALVQSAVIAGLVLAAADVFVVMKRNRKRTRMTKKEVTDENKSSEGDPMVKSQRRARQLAMSRNRMIAAVATSDVVLVNPTHFAVALRYEPGKSAPRVVATGAGVIAARIREQAETDRVPIVRDIPLTRALHSACQLGDEIPVELYNAVAQVLAFVLALKSRGSGAGGRAGHGSRVHTLDDRVLTAGGHR